MRRILRHALVGTAVGVATTVAVSTSISSAPAALVAPPADVLVAAGDLVAEPRSAERAERASRSSARTPLAEAASAERREALRQQQREIRARQRALAETRAKAEAKRKKAAEAAKERRQAAKKRGYELGTTAPRAIARQIMANKFDWGSSEFRCYDLLIKSESNWRVRATNPSSGAYGIPQALPGHKMASAGKDWRTNPATQISWGLGYVKDRYGTPCQAWSFKQGHNWY